MSQQLSVCVCVRECVKRWSKDDLLAVQDPAVLGFVVVLSDSRFLLWPCSGSDLCELCPIPAAASEDISKKGFCFPVLR